MATFLFEPTSKVLQDFFKKLGLKFPGSPLIKTFIGLMELPPEPATLFTPAELQRIQTVAPQIVNTSADPFDQQIQRKRMAYIRNAWKAKPHREIFRCWDLVLFALNLDAEFKRNNLAFFTKAIDGINNAMRNKQLLVRNFPEVVAAKAKEKEVDKASSETKDTPIQNYVLVQADAAQLGWLTVIRDFLLFLHKHMSAPSPPMTETKGPADPLLSDKEKEAVWATLAKIKDEVSDAHEFVNKMGTSRLKDYEDFVEEMRTKMEAEGKGGTLQGIMTVLQEMMFNPSMKEKVGKLRPGREDFKAAVGWYKKHATPAVEPQGPPPTPTPTQPAQVPGGQFPPQMQAMMQQMMQRGPMAPIGAPAPAPAPAPAKPSGPAGFGGLSGFAFPPVALTQPMSKPTDSFIAPSVGVKPAPATEVKSRPMVTPKKKIAAKPVEATPQHKPDDDLRKMMMEMKASMEQLKNENKELKEALTKSQTPSKPSVEPTVAPKEEEDEPINLSELAGFMPPGIDFGAIMNMARQLDPKTIQSALAAFGGGAPLPTASAPSFSFAQSQAQPQVQAKQEASTFSFVPSQPQAQVQPKPEPPTKAKEEVPAFSFSFEPPKPAGPSQSQDQTRPSEAADAPLAMPEDDIDAEAEQEEAEADDTTTVASPACSFAELSDRFEQQAAPPSCGMFGDASFADLSAQLAQLSQSIAVPSSAAGTTGVPIQKPLVSMPAIATAPAPAPAPSFGDFDFDQFTTQLKQSMSLGSPAPSASSQQQEQPFVFGA